MKDNNKLGLIVAYYLSRFSEEGYRALGYSTFAEATRGIGKILDIKPRTIQNYRDDFDPYYDNDRVGWYQRPLGASGRKVIQAFQDLDMHALQEVVDEILSNAEFRESVQCKELLSVFSDKEDSGKKGSAFVIRGETGLKAEEFFVKHHREFGAPHRGVLIDKRQHGCGYDYELIDGSQSWFVEVKGLAANTGGILFTDKEWQVANLVGEKYVLAIVMNLKEGARISFVPNPAKVFSPKKNIYPSVRIDWPVSQKEIQSVLKAGDA